MGLFDGFGTLRRIPSSYDQVMTIQNRNQRRAAKGRKQKIALEQEHRALPDALREQMNKLAAVGGFANHVSMALTGLPTSSSGQLASMVFAKCCAHARSIGAIVLQSSMFDHHAIMTLARMMMEASTMIAYLLDPVSEEEWQFRYNLLKLHDTVGRLKLMGGFEQPADDLRAGREDLKAQIEVSSIFNSLPEERRKRLASGEEMFAIGMRSVATKLMGWDDRQFNGIYAYLSAHAHTAPMSFTRMADHRIDYFYPSETQFQIPALSMEIATACLRRSMLRMLQGHPETVTELHPELLAEAYKDDAECPFFNKPLQTS